MPQMQFAQEKRQSARSPVSRPAKVFHVPSRRYLPALTCDASAGGMLLKVLSARRLRPGEELEVMVAWTPRVLLEASEHVKATVIHTLSTGGAQLVGVRFSERASARRAA